MLSFFERDNGITRREMLRIGGLGMAGLTLPNLLVRRREPRRQRGPHLWPGEKSPLPLPGRRAVAVRDVRPQARRPGRDPRHLQAHRHQRPRRALLRTAAAHRPPSPTSCAVVRSMATGDPNHESGGYWVNTGHRYTGPNMRAVHPTDWPTFGSVVKMLKPSTTVPFTLRRCCPSRSSPTPASSCPARTAASSAAAGTPRSSAATPPRPGFQIEGFIPAARPAARRGSRAAAASSSNSTSRPAGPTRTTASASRTAPSARRCSVVLSSKAARRFDLEREPAAVRDRYGRGKWGQSLLLARRLHRGRRAHGVRQLAARAGRPHRRQPAVGHALQEQRAHEGRAVPAIRPRLPRPDRGPATSAACWPRRWWSPSARWAGRRRSTAAAAATTGATSVSFVLAGAGIRTGQVVGASDKKRRGGRRRPGHAVRPDRDDVPPARHRPPRHVPRQVRPAAPGHRGRADPRRAGVTIPHRNRWPTIKQRGKHGSIHASPAASLLR